MENISKWWRYSTLIVIFIGFSILSLVTKLAYDNAPPIPEKVITPSGNVVFTGEQIKKGQNLFFRYNLMEHGTLWGHGAYLGPDFSAEYLHQETESIRNFLSHQMYDSPFDALTEASRGSVTDLTIRMIKENRFNAETNLLVYTDAQKAAFDEQVQYWTHFFQEGAPGLPENYIQDAEELTDLTAFFSWSAWAAGALRPETNNTYTNNFPYDPDAGNLPSADAYFWSAVSLIALLGGIGLLLFLFGKFDFLGWQSERTARHVHVDHSGMGQLTPSQKAIGKFFAIVGFLFLAQSLIGGGLAHYRVEQTFYGLPIAEILPYNLMRTWHLQLAIFWIATAWVAGGLFIAPILSGKEPKFQKLGVNVFFVALLIVAVGSLVGEFFSTHGYLKNDLWFWFGAQGSEYLDLGRFWQYLLIVGFLFWLFLLFRALNPMNKEAKNRELIILFFIAGAAIPIFYVPAVFYDTHTNYSIIDNWRFWIIHLWVEGFFEVFATVLVAVIFTRMGLVKQTVALRLIYLDALLYLGSGVVGTGHHWYFTGQTTVNMALSACFSAMEIIPLTLLTLDAWDFIRASRTNCADCGESLMGRQVWTVYFLIAVGVWNFIGAGVFGFLINLPVISYFELGTNLTPNHGHAAMFGVFGMLAIGLTMFCVRAQHNDTSWTAVKKWVKIGFWGMNIGMGLMIVLDLFPAGILQLWDSMTHGYWHARRLSYIMSGTFHLLEWVRIVGDMVFIVAGVLPTAYAIFYTYFHERRKNREKSSVASL